MKTDNTKTHLIFVGHINERDNIKAFLTLPDELGTKTIIGFGNDRYHLKEKYTHVTFEGYMGIKNMEDIFTETSVLVMPYNPKSDTVILRANRAGVPVAGFLIDGPTNFVVDHLNGVLDNDLETAIINAATLNREAIRKYAQDNT